MSCCKIEHYSWGERENIKYGIQNKQQFTPAKEYTVRLQKKKSVIWSGYEQIGYTFGDRKKTLYRKKGMKLAMEKGKYIGKKQMKKKKSQNVYQVRKS